MALDVYAPCPCGSGKKLKFCCPNLAEDMERVSRQMESNQPRQALQQLEVLDRRHPNNAWVVTTRALVQIEIGEAAGVPMPLTRAGLGLTRLRAAAATFA